MTYYLQLTDEAADQLFAIARWYAETSQSLEIAATWYDGFLNKLETLEENPLRGGLAPENNLFDFELRELYYGSGKHKTHRAIFRIVGARIEVLSIRHLTQQYLGPTDLD